MANSLEERKQSYLSAAAVSPGREQAGFIPLLANGLTEAARVSMARTIALVRQRVDCVDFRLNMLMRAWYRYGERIPADVRADIRDVLGNALYYGCFSAARPLFRNSENHHLQYAVAEHLAAQILEGGTFADGRTAQEHLARSRELILRWIDRRLRFGYCEWNSSVYQGVNLASLLNVYDFARDGELRRQAEAATTRLMADLAGESLNGAVFAAQARIYEKELLRPVDQVVQPAFAIWLGIGDVPAPVEWPHLCLADHIATSDYVPPDWLARAARPQTGEWVVRERHRVELGPFYKNRSLYWQAPEEITDEAAMRRFYPEGLAEVCIRTERRREWIASTAWLDCVPQTDPVEPHQAMVWMGALNGRTPVFTTHPKAAAARDAEKTYWSGSITAPRCWVAGGVVAAHYPPGGVPAAEFTHAYFPTQEFDAWTQDGAWWFAAQGEAYVALTCSAAVRLTDQGAWAGKELIAAGRGMGWVAVFGARETDGSLDGFRARCAGARIAWPGPNAGMEVRLGATHILLPAKGTPVVNGAVEDFVAWPQMESPMWRGEYGQTELSLRE